MPAFSVQDLPLKARLSIWRGDYLDLTLTAAQPGGAEVSWFGFTGTLIKPVSFPGTVVLDQALVGNPGAGNIQLTIDTALIVTDVRGNFAVEVESGGLVTTLFSGLLTCDKSNPTRLRMQSGCGLDIDSACKEPIAITVPGQGIRGATGAPGIGGASIRSGRIGVGSFAGDPLAASIAFSSALADNDYSVTIGLEAPGPRQIPVSADNRTASGFDLVLGSQDIAGIVAVNWLAIPTA